MEETAWLSVVECEDIEYVADIQNRCFSQLAEPMENVAFHSEEDKEMARMMTGTERRAWTPREIEGDRGGVV